MPFVQTDTKQVNLTHVVSMSYGGSGAIEVRDTSGDTTYVTVDDEDHATAVIEAVLGQAVPLPSGG